MMPVFNIRRLHRDRFVEYRGHALAAVGDPRLGLVMLHAPIPHAPAIYDRASGTLTAWSLRGIRGYFDNLALADRFVGEVQRELERAGVANRTWLLVTSDHWWRDGKPYDGTLDLRVPFLLQAPTGSRAVSVTSAFNTAVTGDLLLAILRGDIVDTDAAARWLRAHPMAPPTSYTPQGRPRY